MHAITVALRRKVSTIFNLSHFREFSFTNFPFRLVVDVNHSNAAASTLNGKSSPGLSQDVVDQIQRPSVDSLLDELSHARSVSPVYAIPHESVEGKPKSGRHVTITVRETTTERVSGTPSQCKFLLLA